MQSNLYFRQQLTNQATNQLKKPVQLVLPGAFVGGTTEQPLLITPCVVFGGDFKVLLAASDAIDKN